MHGETVDELSHDLASRHSFADAEFDELSGRLTVGGVAVDIEPRPLRLLKELLQHVNEVLTKDELLESIWDGRPTVDHVLANAVSKLRAALGPQAGARIVTLPRLGYRLDGPIHKVCATLAAQRFAPGQAVPGRAGFALVQPLGQGAQSDVWLARHGKLCHTTVFKFAQDGARLVALKREYTLYRVLAHALGPRPDMATVLDANFETAPYYLECAYGGLNLAEWAELGVASMPEESPHRPLQSMRLNERLQLFLQILGAVAAAHSVGVLHKDLKPSNILVDGQPGAWQAKLTDFGSGRLLDRARLAELKLTALGLTQTQDDPGQHQSGTLLYMAPEVLAGHAPSTQSDVYALGLILYQLMVGDLRRPLSTGWEREVPDELIQEDIRAATEGSPQARLQSASELAERLTQLETRRTQARERQALEQRAAHDAMQVARTRARRPWMAAAVVSLGLGCVFSFTFWWQARAERQVAVKEALRAQAINDFLSKDVLASANVSRGSKTYTLLDVLDHAAAHAKERFALQPETEAAICLQLAQSYLRLDNLQAATEHFSRAKELLAPLRPANDPELLSSEFGLSSTLSARFLPDQAKANLDLARQNASPALLEAHPALAYQATKAQHDWAHAKGQHKEAGALAQQMLTLADRGPPFTLADRLEARQYLAEAHLQLQENDQAKRLIDEIEKPPFDTPGVGPVALARTLMQSARLDRFAKDLNSAEQKLLMARSELLNSVGPLHYYYGFVTAELGDLYAFQGRPPRDMARSLQEALKAFRASLGESHEFVHTTAVNLAIFKMDEGRHAEALDEMNAERAWFITHKGRPALMHGIDFHRARALVELKRPQEAFTVLESLNGDRLAESAWGDDWPWILKGERALALLGMHRDGEGRTLLEEVVKHMHSSCDDPIECARYFAAEKQYLKVDTKRRQASAGTAKAHQERRGGLER